MQHLPHPGVVLVVMGVLARRLVGVAAAERSIGLKGPRVSPGGIDDLA